MCGGSVSSVGWKGRVVWFGVVWGKVRYGRVALICPALVLTLIFWLDFD